MKNWTQESKKLIGFKVIKVKGKEIKVDQNSRQLDENLPYLGIVGAEVILQLE